MRASNKCGQIAQSVEQRIENPCVGSSILPLATTSYRPFGGYFLPEYPPAFLNESAENIRPSLLYRFKSKTCECRSHETERPQADIKPAARFSDGLRPCVLTDFVFPNVKTASGYTTTDACLFYSELNLNQYSVGSPCRTICTVCGSPPCPDLNLIHYIFLLSL